MKFKISEKDIMLMDKAIKIYVAATGDFAAPQNLLSRLIWNICFNPKEYVRSKKMVEGICNESRFKDTPECQGCLPK